MRCNGASRLARRGSSRGSRRLGRGGMVDAKHGECGPPNYPSAWVTIPTTKLTVPKKGKQVMQGSIPCRPIGRCGVRALGKGQPATVSPLA